MAKKKVSRSRSVRKAPARRRAPARRAAATPASSSAAAPSAHGWSVYALGYAMAVLGALDVLIVWLFRGKMAGAAALYESLLFSFSGSGMGLIAGMAEAAVYGLIGGWLLAWLYNKWA